MSLNKPTTLTLWALFFVVSLTSPLRAAGELDPGFNAAAFGITNGTAYVVKKQADGKILVGGYFSAANGTAAPALVRLNADGSVDPSFTVQNLFNSLGIGASVWSIAVQGDGKILIGGHFLTSTGVAQPGVRRLNPDGSLDAGFTPFIVVSGSAIYDIEILPDGRIIAGGLFSGPNLPNNIVRLEANGTWDPGFASLSGFGVKNMEVQPDGKLLIVGWDPSTTTVGLIRRLTTSGTTDGTFPSLAINGRVEAVKNKPNGQFLIGGAFTSIEGFTVANFPPPKGGGNLKHVWLLRRA